MQVCLHLILTIGLMSLCIELEKQIIFITDGNKKKDDSLCNYEAKDFCLVYQYGQV